MIILQVHKLLVYLRYFTLLRFRSNEPSINHFVIYLKYTCVVRYESYDISIGMIEVKTLSQGKHGQKREAL